MERLNNLTKALAHFISWFKEMNDLTKFPPQVYFYVSPEPYQIKLSENDFLNWKEIPSITFWSENIFSYIPKQSYSSYIRSNISENEEYLSIFNNNFERLLYLHSHGSGDPFVSKSEEEDFKENFLNLIVGNLDKDEIKIYSWSANQKVKISKEFFLSVFKTINKEDVKEVNLNTVTIPLKYFVKQEGFLIL